MTVEKIRVLMVEDQVKILRSQVKLLSTSDAIELVGTALTGEEALAQLDALRPQVLLCDLQLPGISGIEVTRRVRAEHPEIEVLIFTIFEEEEKVLEAVRAGASGYLLKGATAARIVEAILEVRKGGTVIQPSLARKLLQHFRVPLAQDEAIEPAAAKEKGPSLSPRETEILRLIAKGLSNAEAAQTLGLSRATVRTHLEHIYEKLEVSNRVEAVTEGIRKGLIEM